MNARHLRPFVLAIAGYAIAQQAPVGDVFQTGGAQAPEAAFRKLYQLTAQVVANPAQGYQPNHNPAWPSVAAVQKGWADAMAQSGNTLTPAQKQWLVPCANHLNQAIDDMERGYIIKTTQKDNGPAQRTAQDLYRKGKALFSQCSSTPPGDVFQTGNGTPGSGANAPGNPGDVFRSGGGTPGSNPGRNPGDVYQTGRGGNPSTGSPGSNPGSNPGDTFQSGSQCQVVADPALQQQYLPSAREALRTFSAMGSQADIVLTTMGKLAAARMASLAQPNSVNNALAASAKAVVDYVSNNDYRSQVAAQLKAAADTAVQQARNNPAQFVGFLGDQALAGAAQNQLMKACPVTPAQIAQLKGGIDKARTSIQRIAGAIQKKQQFTGTFGTGPGNLPRIPGHPPSPPLCSNACVKLATAQDQLWASDETFVINGAQATSGANDLRMTSDQVSELLQEQYGEIVRRSPAFTPEQQFNFSQGIPINANRNQIINFLRPYHGSRGLVFVQFRGSQLGHTFNARAFNNTVEFLDAGQKMDGNLWFSADLRAIFFYPTN